MRLDEVIFMQGFSSMIGPGTSQPWTIVAPRTMQADEPEQSGEEYEKLKNKQKEQPKIDLRPYNKKKEQQKRNYFDDDANPGNIAKMINATVFALMKDPEIKMSKNYTQYAKTIQTDPREQV